MIENLVVFFARIVNQMSIAACSLYAFMARQFLSKANIMTGGVNDGYKVVAKVMDPDCLGINTCLNRPPLDGIPHAARVYWLDLVTNAFVMANEYVAGKKMTVTGAQIIPQGIHSPVGQMDNRLLVTLADNNRPLFFEVNITDTQAAGFRDPQASISQEQNKCSVSKVGNIFSHSITVFYNLHDCILVEYREALSSSQGVHLVRLFEERSNNGGIIVSLEKVQAFDGRPAQGLCGGVHIRSFAEEVYIRLLGKVRVASHSLQKCLQSLFICGIGFTTTRTLYGVQIGIYQGLHVSSFRLSNAYYNE
jgi:hypothetical protein